MRHTPKRWPVRACRRRVQRQLDQRYQDAKQQGNSHRLEAWLRHGLRQIDPAHVEIDPAGQHVALARTGQVFEYGEVPEEQLQQQRHVADDLDVDGRKLGDQPVGGQTGDADDEAESGGGNDADARHQQGVQQPHEERAAVGGGAGIGDERLGDVETRSAAQEVEARGDILPAQVVGDVVDHPDGGERDRHQQQELVGDLAHLRPVEEACKR